jgi:hypothetical protein
MSFGPTALSLQETMINNNNNSIEATFPVGLKNNRLFMCTPE